MSLIGLLVAGTGLPYFLTDPQAGQQLRTHLHSWLAPSGGAYGSGYADYNSSSSGGIVSLFHSGSDLPAASATVMSLEDILRFDITPRWVIEHWPRVTTTLSEQGLEGLRVPCLTGVQLDDLAGAVTYYFDRQHRLQRLTLQATTGDERKLVALVTQRYGLQQEPTLGAGLYAIRWNRRPVSVLRVSHAPVVRAASPHARLEVLLEINRPEGAVQLSSQMQSVLESDQYTQRW